MNLRWVKDWILPVNDFIINYQWGLSYFSVVCTIFEVYCGAAFDILTNCFMTLICRGLYCAVKSEWFLLL